jgi:hypothetical protein
LIEGGVNCLNWPVWGRGREGKRWGVAGFARRRRVGWLRGEEEERKEERVSLTGGAQVSAKARKKKKEAARWAAAG